MTTFAHGDRIRYATTGEARITRGYGLPAKYVIHTVGPVYSGTPKDRQLLTRCYRNSLALAAENDIRTICFPAISCGVYGYPMDQACRVAIDTTRGFLVSNAIVEKVLFILFSRSDRQVYASYMEDLSRG